MTDQPRQEEPTPVQLTRMEGVLNLVAERISNLGGRVDSHENQIGTIKSDVSELKSQTQTLKEGADADKKTAVALALALKEADETRRTKTEQTWTPVQRISVVVAAVASLIAIYFMILPQ